MEGLKVELDGVNKQLEALNKNAEQFRALNLEEAVLKATSGYREQTKELQNNTELLDRRNQLMESGVTGQRLETDMEQLKVLQTLADSVEFLNVAYEKGNITVEQRTEFTDKLTAAAKDQTAALESQYKQQARLAGNEAGRGTGGRQRGTDGAPDAAPAGRSELSASEVLIRDLGDAWNQLGAEQQETLSGAGTVQRSVERPGRHSREDPTALRRHRRHHRVRHQQRHSGGHRRLEVPERGPFRCAGPTGPDPAPVRARFPVRGPGRRWRHPRQAVRRRSGGMEAQ